MLLFDEDERGPDDNLAMHLEAANQLDPDEQRVICSVIEGLVLKHEAQRWTAS